MNPKVLALKGKDVRVTKKRETWQKDINRYSIKCSHMGVGTVMGSEGSVGRVTLPKRGEMHLYKGHGYRACYPMVKDNVRTSIYGRWGLVSRDKGLRGRKKGKIWVCS
jgi:hypothetical protein